MVMNVIYLYETWVFIHLVFLSHILILIFWPRALISTAPPLLCFCHHCVCAHVCGCACSCNCLCVLPSFVFCDSHLGYLVHQKKYAKTLFWEIPSVYSSFYSVWEDLLRNECTLTEQCHGGLHQQLQGWLAMKTGWVSASHALYPRGSQGHVLFVPVFI
jgi:hypothetical protein